MTTTKAITPKLAQARAIILKNLTKQDQETVYKALDGIVHVHVPDLETASNVMSGASLLFSEQALSNAMQALITEQADKLEQAFRLRYSKLTQLGELDIPNMPGRTA